MVKNSGQFKPKDITGIRKGMLTALEPTDKKTSNGTRIWLFKCDCGNNTELAVNKFTSSKWGGYSCGCKKRPGSEATQFKPQDFTGWRNYMVTAIKNTGKREPHAGYSIWLFKCDCGTYFERPAYCITKKGCKVKSCGCTKFKHKYNYGRLPNNGSYINKIFNSYFKSAQERSLNFELSKSQVKKLIVQNCHYCNAEPKERNEKRLAGTFAYNGIDRKQSHIGYVLDNCVPCCWDCNRAKGAMPYEVFLAWIARVYNHSLT